MPLWMKTCLYYTSSLVQMMCLICIAHHCLYWRDAWFILYMHPLSYCTVHSLVLLHSCWQIWEFYLFSQKLRKWYKNHLCDMKLVVLSSFPCWNGKHKSCKINFGVGFLWENYIFGYQFKSQNGTPRPSINSLTPPRSQNLKKKHQKPRKECLSCMKCLFFVFRKLWPKSGSHACWVSKN